MSHVKFEKETIKTTGISGGKLDKSDIAHDIGNALTKATGPNGYLAVCYAQLR
jgi:hypothetical protein